MNDGDLLSAGISAARAGDAKKAAALLAQESPVSEVKHGNTVEKILTAIIACLLMIVLCGSVLGYLSITRPPSQLIDRIAAAIWSPTPTATASVTPSITPPPIPTDTPTPIPTLTPSQTPASISSPTLDEASQSAKAKPFIEQARILMYKDMQLEAIAEWDQVITLMPKNADAYYQRAACYLKLVPNQHSRDVYLDYLNNAVADLDQAIALDPTKGDYYIGRSQVYERLSVEEEYRLNYLHLEEIALENSRVANQLGNTEPDSERSPAFELIDLGRCEEGITEAHQLIVERGPTAPSSAGLNNALAQGYLCLGQLDKALEHINLAIELYPEWRKTWTKSVILYNMGRLDEALALLNDDIEQFPDYAGYRYFLRAAIYAEQGKLAEAEADIKFGYGQIWGYYGLVPYAEGRLALKRNDRVTALEKFQYAEASITYDYGPLIKRIQSEIADLGGQPLIVTPKVFMSTPIPTPLITATPRASSTFVYCCTPTPTSIPSQPPPLTGPAITYELVSNRIVWNKLMGGNIATEDFQKDFADYGELNYPYITGNGFTLTGQSPAQILQDATLLNSGTLLHFRDWKVGLTFTFPNDADVSGFGFDYQASETWQLTVGNSVITVPAGRPGFIGIVIHAGNLNQFILSCTSSAQGGLTVDNISYVKK
jgi:tetratricopeptide (TPR) repeat protein